MTGGKDQVTANIFAIAIDTGNKISTSKACGNVENAATQAAFIAMSAMMPPLTAFPMLGADGSFIALNSGW